MLSDDVVELGRKISQHPPTPVDERRKLRGHLHNLGIAVSLDQVHLILSSPLVALIILLLFLLSRLTFLEELFFLISLSPESLQLPHNFVRNVTGVIDCVLQIVGDVGLLGDALVVGQDVWEGREVVGFRVLDGVRAEDVDSWRVDIYPLVPTGSPSVIMYVNGVLSDLRYLGLQPLIDGVLNIEPHTNLELPLGKVEL